MTILHTHPTGYVSFQCPGCNDKHCIPVEGPRAWGYNGNPDKPTFTPSILVTSGHYVPRHKPGDQCWCTWDKADQADFDDFKCTLCHSFVTDGRIQFLADCTHVLAGQTVDLPGWDDGLIEAVKEAMQ
jgi:Family of unknown function (DUF6527)